MKRFFLLLLSLCVLNPAFGNDEEHFKKFTEPYPEDYLSWSIMKRSEWEEEHRIPTTFEKYARRGKEFSKKVWANRHCRRGIYALAGFGTATIGTYTFYNWPKRDGEWINEGTEENPILIPQVGDTLIADRTITMLTLPMQRTMRIHNGSEGFGQVHYDAEKILYSDRKGRMVASTDIISPYGRPFDAQTPIEVTIYDGAGYPIGKVEEVSDEVDIGVHAVSFRILDSKGAIVGTTDSVNEWDSAKPVSGPWQTTLQGPGIETFAKRGGFFTNRYKFEGAEPVDARLLVILAAYKDYVDSYRK